MLDDLLGRTELKDRIETLKERCDRLDAQLEAESRRRTDAVSAKQDVEERANRLEDRIADLEGKLDVDRRDEAEFEFRYEETLRGARIDSVLSRLSSFESEPETVTTAYVEDDPPSELREALGSHTALVSRAAPSLVCVDDAGVVAVTLRPPVAPEPFVERSSSPVIDRSWFRPTGRFALALIRSDIFALGIYDGTDRVSFEGFESNIKSDHSKGGFSQARFERIRDGQIADHIEKCESALSAVDADRRYVVGDRRLIDEFDADASAAVDATGKPKAALEDAFSDFWSVKLFGL